MKLEKIIPKKTSFTLSTTGNTYYLRPFTLLDEIWMKQEFGDKVLEIFNPDSPDFEAISRIVYNQIENRDDFKATACEITNEDGIKEDKHLGGYKLLAEMIINPDEKIALITCINECMGYSRPAIDPKKKTPLLKRLIGQK